MKNASLLARLCSGRGLSASYPGYWRAGRIQAQAHTLVVPCVSAPLATFPISPRPLSPCSSSSSPLWGARWCRTRTRPSWPPRLSPAWAPGWRWRMPHATTAACGRCQVRPAASCRVLSTHSSARLCAGRRLCPPATRCSADDIQGMARHLFALKVLPIVDTVKAHGQLCRPPALVLPALPRAPLSSKASTRPSCLTSALARGLAAVGAGSHHKGVHRRFLRAADGSVSFDADSPSFEDSQFGERASFNTVWWLN